MEEEYKLIKYDGSEFLDKIRYLYFLNVEAKDWQRKYQVMCLVKKIPVISQGNLSDYEYFLKTHPIQLDNDYNIYYLLVNNNPVTMVTTHLESSGLIDISFTTASKFQQKGYAKEAALEVMRILMQDENVYGIKMVDMSNNGATSKIANHLGLQYDENMNWFYMLNPNYKKSKREI